MLTDCDVLVMGEFPLKTMEGNESVLFGGAARAGRSSGAF